MDDKSARRTAKRVFDRLKDECGFTGGYTIVRITSESKSKAAKRCLCLSPTGQAMLRRTLVKDALLSSPHFIYQFDLEFLGRAGAYSGTGKTNPAEPEETLTLTYPLQIKRRGVETKLFLGGVALGQPDPDLIKLIAQARYWYDGLKTGRFKSIEDIGVAMKMDSADISRRLSLAFLAPSIVHDIIKGQHPIDLTLRDLNRKASRLPLDWSEQRRFLGMNS